MVLPEIIYFITGPDLQNEYDDALKPVLRNRSYFYGSGSDFWQVTVPVPAPYLDHKKHSFLKKNLEKILPFDEEKLKIDR